MTKSTKMQFVNSSAAKRQKFVEKSVNWDVHGRNCYAVSSVTGDVLENVAVLAQMVSYQPAEQGTFEFHSRTYRLLARAFFPHH